MMPPGRAARRRPDGHGREADYYYLTVTEHADLVI